MRNFKIRNIHFVGIGGIGMSGIAEVLLNQGYNVSGSDMKITDVTLRLQELGATIYEGHKAENVGDTDVLVYSSAVNEDNEEVREAINRKIPYIKRAEMLAELMRMKYGVAIAGTHGKTTTTSMTGMIVTEGGLKPTIIIGGKVKAFASNAVLGSSEFLVAEADEYDKSFLKLNPTIAVITNIEPDHLECYGSLNALKEAFVTFANKIPFYGSAIVCLDEKYNQEILPRLQRNVITYGFLPHADYHIFDYESDGFISRFRIKHQNKDLGEFEVYAPGEHNIKNATAAVVSGIQLQISLKKIKDGLAKFSGVIRRFEIKAKEKGIYIIDDYAHHPTEIRATLNAARKVHGSKRIIAAFQPHLFSRTRDYLQDFAGAFFQADELIVTEIYPAREKPIIGIDGELVAEAADKRGHKNVKFIKTLDSVVEHISQNWQKDDMIITMGAGNIWKVSDRLKEKLVEG